MSISYKGLMRKCRRHNNNKVHMFDCYYCWRSYYIDKASNIRPEELLLWQVFGESRFISIRSKKSSRRS